MYLRVSLTDRCNLRCVYCLPESARFAQTHATSAELMRLTELIVATADVKKIRLTGGEPTLCDDLVEHVRHARALVPLVGMTTNGVLLEPLLPKLRDAGLQRINISMDAIDADAFTRTTRRPGLDRVIASIRAAKRLGFSPVKINAVALQNTDYSALVRFAAWEGVHMRFIELMAIGEARPFQAREYVDAQTMRARIHLDGIQLLESQQRDEPTSRVYAIDQHALDDCSVGFITTTSAPFCATCNRLRLSSQGRLHTCLMDDVGHDLLTDLRRGDDAAVIARIRIARAGKRPPAAFVRQGVMADIGG